MTTKSLFHVSLLTGAFTLALMISVHAADKRHLGGPHGGRFLEKTTPKAEFFIEKDQTVSIRFYDPASRQVAATTQSATVIAEGKSGKQTLTLEKQGERLISRAKLPDGDGYMIVVQFQQSPAVKPHNFRFKLELQTCGGCQRPEYACHCIE